MVKQTHYIFIQKKKKIVKLSNSAKISTILLLNIAYFLYWYVLTWQRLVINTVYQHNWHQRSHCQTFFIRNIIELTSNLLNCALSQYALIQMGAGAAGELGEETNKTL